MRLRPALALALFAAGCGDELAISVTAAPAEGIGPLAVRLEAAPFGEARALRYRFDADGDGTFDTEYGDDAFLEHTYAAAGAYAAVAEAVDGGGRSAVATVRITVLENRAPVPALSLSPAGGRQPVRVTLDPSGSVDPEAEAPPLEARFDFEGDGRYDTEWAPLAPLEHVYSNAGAFTPKVEVRDFRGASAVAEGTLTIAPGVDLDADTDRDGRITDEDDPSEDTFGPAGGAVFVANVDDDDGDGAQDWRDASLSGLEDVRDLAPIIIRRYEGLPAGATVKLSVNTEASSRVRLFEEAESGEIVELKPPEVPEVDLDAARLARGDVRLFAEGVSGRDSRWDGRTVLTLTVSRPDDGTTEADSVEMRVSPVLFPDNTRPAEKVYVMRISDRQLAPNLPFYDAVVELTPGEVEVYTVDQYEYLGDRWTQDNMQTGYQAMPAEAGVHVVETYLETVRSTGGEGLEYLVTQELLGPDLGYFFPGGGETSLNYGGNIEITPPYGAMGLEHPFGRTIVGGGAGGTIQGRAYEDHMTRPQREWLDAQPQGPTIELSTEWLLVGHLDEIFQFVPNPSRSNGKDFMLVLASPELAVSSIVEMANDGLGATAIFAGRAEETRVSRILADSALLSFNEAVQARIDTIREGLMGEMGLTDADIVEVPVLYEMRMLSGWDFAVAYNPGIQNLVVLRDTLLVPDPEGPDRGGEDVWQRKTRDVLEPLGLTVHFVDIYESYHVNFGEAHCGTEVEHAPHDVPWWERD